MSNKVEEIGNENETFKDKACEKIGYFIFGLAVKVNKFSKYCLLHSCAKNRIEEALDSLDKKEDIGAKVINYDEGVADVISEPIESLRKMRAEVSMSNNEALSCQDFVEKIHEAWLEKDDKLMSILFNEYGFYGRIEG
jgi:hypothetical protein